MARIDFEEIMKKVDDRIIMGPPDSLERQFGPLYEEISGVTAELKEKIEAGLRKQKAFNEKLGIPEDTIS